MKIKLAQLQDVVKDAIRNEDLTENLRVETKRVLGPMMNTNLPLVELAETINDRLDVLEMTGRKCGSFKTSLIVKFAGSKNSEIRAMAARLLPENLSRRFTTDPSSKVRAVIASRVDLKIVKEMMKKFPNDDELRLIYSRRNQTQAITEAMSTTEMEDDFDLYGDEALGDLSRQYDVELSDEWYRTKARDLMNDYSKHREPEYNWVTRAVSNFCDHSKVTSSVEIDKKKLLDAVNELIEERDDATLERTNMLDLRVDESNQYDEFDFEVLKTSPNASAFPVITETIDPVQTLINENNTPQEFKKLFKVQVTTVPQRIKDYLIGESYSTQKIPVKAQLPHMNEIRSIDEKCLDRFVEQWNRDQIIKNEPFKISWHSGNSDDDCSEIQFKVELR